MMRLVMATYSNPIVKVTDRSIENIVDAQERKMKSRQLEEQRIMKANSQGATFGFHRSIDITLIEDVAESDECEICKSANSILYMVEVSDDTNRPYSENDTTLRSALICVNCLESKFTEIGCAKYLLPQVTYDDV